MITTRDINKAIVILEHMTTALLSVPAQTGRAGFSLRQAVGDLMADAEDLIRDGKIGTELYACFEESRTAGATLETMNRVRQAMMAEAPTNDFGVGVKMCGIVFSLAEQAQMIAAMTFSSRGQVETLMLRMTQIIDDVKLEVCDLLDGMNYQYVVQMSAALVQHLAATERQLPRIVSYTFADFLPSVVLANRLYGDAGRSDEIIAENGTVHPAFCQRELVALSE